MNPKFNFTGSWKMMNMAKLGTVSAVGNYFHLTGNPRKYRACGMTRYTLCEYQGKASEPVTWKIKSEKTQKNGILPSAKAS
jgi:hypothetical protein